MNDENTAISDNLPQAEQPGGEPATATEREAGFSCAAASRATPVLRTSFWAARTTSSSARPVRASTFCSCRALRPNIHDKSGYSPVVAQPAMEIDAARIITAVMVFMLLGRNARNGLGCWAESGLIMLLFDI